MSDPDRSAYSPQRVRSVGFAVWGIVFPGVDVRTAVALAAQAGCLGLVLDVESGTAIPVSEAIAWGRAVHSVGATAVLYSSRAFCLAVAATAPDAVDAYWWAGGSEYDTGGPEPTSVQTVGGRPTAWQWWGGHTEAGAGVDRSIADVWFAAVAPPPPVPVPVPIPVPVPVSPPPPPPAPGCNCPPEWGCDADGVCHPPVSASSAALPLVLVAGAVLGGWWVVRRHPAVGRDAARAYNRLGGGGSGIGGSGSRVAHRMSTSSTARPDHRPGFGDER